MPLRPRPAQCEFELVLKRPPGDYEELGVIAYNDAGKTWHRYKAFVREAVCEIGGDVVVTTSNGFGYIIAGQVLRRI